MLPIELWREICHSLPSCDLKNVLSVSRFAHGLAVDLLFSTINLYFLPAEIRDDRYYHHSLRFAVEDSERHTKRSWEILNHIVCNRQFSQIVKTLRVHAVQVSLFETLSVAHAISLLPNLRNVHWFHSDLPDSIAQVLPEHLEGLHLPKFTSLTNLQHLCSLQEIHVLQMLPRFVCGTPNDISNEAEEEQPGAASNLIIRQCNSLRKLMLASQHLAELPVRSYHDLTDLEICYSPMESSGLDLVLHHASNLTALAITGWLPADLFLTLKFNSKALPQLRSFCILAAYIPSPPLEEVECLAQFLEGRDLLSRLFIGSPSWDNIIDCLLPTIVGLPRLVTLGLETESAITDTVFPRLCQALPSHLEALHVYWSVDPQGYQNGIHPFVGQLSCFRCLSFLSAASNEYLPYQEVASLVSELDVRVVALDGRLWDITKVESDVTATQWTHSRVESCTPETWFSEDYYWLFRYAGEPFDKL